MLALDFREAVAECGAEILVGRQDFACRCELDDRLRTGDRVELAGILGCPRLGGGDVGCELHHLVRFAVAEHRVVARLDPDFAAALGDALVGIGVELAAPEAGPEVAVFLRLGVVGRAEHAMVLADDFRKAVAERLAEVLIGGQDLAGQVELNDGLRLRKRGDDLARICNFTESEHCNPLISFVGSSRGFVPSLTGFAGPKRRNSRTKTNTGLPKNVWSSYAGPPGQRLRAS
ncbi:hypothetical protein D9M68_637110 [compost metagenome]